VSLVLNDSQAYCVGIYRVFRPSNKNKLEALAQESDKSTEEALGAYLSNFLIVTSILMIFKVSTYDDKKVTKYFDELYKKLVEEFLDINEACNKYSLSILNVAKSANKYSVQALLSGKDSEYKYLFEQKIPKHFLILRAQLMRNFSDNSYKKTISDFFANVGLRL